MDIKVSDLVARFDSGQIRLPIMQRDYVWKPRKVVKLLDLLYKKWPIGSFYVWQSHDKHLTKTRAGGVLAPHAMDGIYGYLLDGQQRLTSLSLAIRGESDGEQEERAYFDLENEAFFLWKMSKTIQKRIYAEDPTIVPLSDVIYVSSEGTASPVRATELIIQRLRDKKKLANNTEVRYRERLKKLSELLTKTALCEEFPDEDEENAFELFSRLNKGGTSLSAGDVEAARLASKATRKIVQPMRDRAADKHIRQMGINFILLLRSLVTVQRHNCSFSKLPKSWADDAGEIETSWARAVKALDLTVEFVRAEFGWTNRRWIPSANALIPVIYLFASPGKHALTEDNIQSVRSYLLISGLRGVFRGTTETTVNSYVTAIRNAGSDFSPRCKALEAKTPKNRRYKIKKEDIIGTSGMYSPVMQIYLAMLCSLDAKSWPSGRPLKDILLENLENDPVAVHHIFPKQFMTHNNVPANVNTVANYAIISQADNATLGDLDPLVAWSNLTSSQKENAAKQLYFIAAGDYFKHEAYDEFLTFRAEKMAAKLNEFLALGV